MLEKSYKTMPTFGMKSFIFESKGEKGTIRKVIYFQEKGEKINVAFGDYSKGIFSDRAVSGNSDYVQVIATVIQCIYKYSAKYPNRSLQIKPVDSKRKRFYNLILRRRHLEFEKDFEIFGIFGKKKIRYNPLEEYDSFEIIRKKNE